MAEITYDLTQPNSGMNYRFVQPPQIAYFINTVDGYGNVNTTPATLGTCISVDMDPATCGSYYFTFSLGHTDLPQIAKRQAVRNLEKNPECVIAFIGAPLVRAAQIACLPLPEGIDEMETAGLTPLPSRHVRPPGIRECGINLEARVEHTLQVGRFYRHYVCRVLAVTVDEDLVKRDHESTLHAGTFEIDPLFELTILGRVETRPPRLYFIRLDRSTVERMPDDFGPTRAWVGSFEDWLLDEVGRGKLTDNGRKRILSLHEAWRQNPNPADNGDVKRELTERLRALTAL